MATMRTTLRDWFGLAGKTPRMADSRHVLLARWLRRIACLGAFFAVGGGVMQALQHPWGADATGLGLTMLALALVMSSAGDRTDRKALQRQADGGSGK